jgi:hypothetical protein
MQFEPTPKWNFRLFAKSGHRFHVPSAPCGFFRFTQRWILGFVWERLEEREPWYMRALAAIDKWIN